MAFRNILIRIIKNPSCRKILKILLEDLAAEDFRELGKFMQLGYGSTIMHPWNCIVGVEKICIGNNFRANTGLFLGAYGPNEGEPQIIIGNNVVINYDSQITATNRVEIGDDVLTGSRILITDHSHGAIDIEALRTPPIQRKLVSKGPVLIGKRVWIGSGAIIMPGVTIGEDSIVGANSVVTHSFPAKSVIAGNPAKIVRSL